MAAALSLASRYHAFTNSVFDGIGENLPGWSESLSELDLQSLWFAGEFGNEFTSMDGKRIMVRDFGIWNHAAGPDFTGCALQCGDEILRGDIELDPDVRDWERHGHGGNENYERVVLHLFMQAPEARMFTRTAAHREVTQVWLKPEMLRDAAQPRRMAEARLGRCATPLSEMESAQVSSLVEAAAQFRLRRKSEKLHALIRIHGREQAVYQSLANALGYRHNQRAFTILTQRLPLKVLLKHDAPEREALLFGVSGFLESVRYEDTEPETRAYLRVMWSCWWKLRNAYVNWLEEPNRPRWQIAGARPGNHPQRRLGALCALLDSWKKVFAALRTPKAWSRKGFTAALLALEHEYWSRHYTLMSEPATKSVALIGDTRVQEMLANVVYPLLVPERGDLWAEFMELPALLDNQKVRRAALRLFGEDPRARTFQKRLYQQQGLLQIYEDYCLEDDSACEGCPFPEKMKEWRA
ncbi:MAG: DUF2851 family protein [Verrucomicrobia bacterium]|nr:DUF2851 family protein [Verrucomicrobiota bacterium]